jgi:hypothetical protein
VQSPKPAQFQDMLVSDLIDQERKQWKETFIATIFMSGEASIILNIPLSPLLLRNRLIWRGTKNGIFIVQSAYHLGMERKALQLPGCSGNMDDKEEWKTCWKLNVPNAVKMYLWRACHNLLPTKANLFRRGVGNSKMCLVCLSKEEMVVHACWDCPAAKDVWGVCNIKLQKSTTGGRDFMQVFKEVSSRCEKDEVELFAVVARWIWLRRNDLVHGGTFTHPTLLLKSAKNALEEYQRLNARVGEQDNRERAQETVV